MIYPRARSYACLGFALLKTTTSRDDPRQQRIWAIYWVFYALVSFIGHLFGTDLMAITATYLLLLTKFNVSFWEGGGNGGIDRGHNSYR